MTEEERTQKVLEARQRLESAITDIIRLVREDDEGSIFLQDYAMVTACESMKPGMENFTLTNTLCRVGMSAYSVIGMHNQAANYYLNGGTAG